MLSKKVIIPLMVATIGTAGLVGVGAVYAQAPNQGLVQALAQKFNLDQTQVQQFFDQYRSTQKTNLQQKMNQMEDQRLSNLVSQGKITSDQKTAIENELVSLKAKYLTNLSGQTAAERKQARQNFQNDWQAFLKAQNIDPNVLRPFRGIGFARGRIGK